MCLNIIIFADRQCKLVDQGYDYMGSRSTTINNKTCLRWDDFAETASLDFHDVSSFRGRENYCRNPGLDRQLSSVLNENGPWCIVDNDGTVEECEIPTCGK